MEWKEEAERLHEEPFLVGTSILFVPSLLQGDGAADTRDFHFICFRSCTGRQ